MGIEMKRTFTIATSSVYAAMYVALVYVFSPISYGQIQLRIANTIIGLVPIMGWSAIIGQTVGVFLANIGSPLGPIDLVNVVPSFVMSWLVWRLRRVSVFLGLTLYSIALGVSVSLALNFAFGLSFIAAFPYVTSGIFVTTSGLGYTLYRVVKRTGILARYFGR